MRHKNWVFLGIVFILIISGCASIRINESNGYPFKAGFKVRGVLNSRPIMMDGALVVNSSASAVAEFYTPGGLAAYSVSISDGRLTVMDMWGRVISESTLPVRYVPGLLAGFPPSGLYIFKTRKARWTIVHYLWGRVYLDSLLRPVRVNTSFDNKPVIVKCVSEKRQSGNIELRINVGSDRILIVFQVICGGRW